MAIRLCFATPAESFRRNDMLRFILSFVLVLAGATTVLAGDVTYVLETPGVV